MKILFLVPYPLKEAPSQRFRFEQYFTHLIKQGHSYQVQSFLDSSNWNCFYHPGRSFDKLRAILKGFFKRVFILLKLKGFDFVFIHREATPVGPPAFEWLISKVFKKKIIYDFDDAIWLTDRKNESWTLRFSKWRSKVAYICRWSHRISAGNAYLCDFARAHSNNVVYNPTTIDTEALHNRNLYQIDKDETKITIGWTGTQSTLKYLNSIVSVIQQLQMENDFRFLVIANQKPDLVLQSLDFLPWSLKNEIPDLIQIDIGIMPLPNDKWTNGKCGFKALQYMALEIPAVVSAVGVNNHIIDDGVNGYLCSSETDWYLRLNALLKNKALRKRMGQAGRAKVVSNYSIYSNSSTFLNLFSSSISDNAIA